MPSNRRTPLPICAPKEPAQRGSTTPPTGHRPSCSAPQNIGAADAGELGKMTKSFQFAHETFLFHTMRCDRLQVRSNVTRWSEVQT
jgi:hypothetical protein